MSTITVRHDVKIEDLQAIIDLHGTVYAKECGWNASFKAYVARPLIEISRSTSSRNRLWLAEDGGNQIGCVGIVAASTEMAQLRFLLVEPAFRRQGLGKRLLDGALGFAKEQEYAKIGLWTEKSLMNAARVAAGFVMVEEQPVSWKWGSHVVEQRYELQLRS